MSTIFVLGTSIAGVKAAQELKAKRPEDTVTVYSLDGSLPIDRDGIADVLAKNKTLSEIDYRIDDLTLETEQKISKVNLNRKRLYLESKEQIPFDQVVVADTGSWRFPDIKGTRKTGCMSLKSRKDLEAVLDQVQLSDDIVLQSENLEGLIYALALTKRDRTVTLAYSGRNLLPGGVDRETEEAFCAYCKTQGLTVYPRTTIDEILGDSDIKAVRLSAGKVIAAQCVLFTDMKLDIRIFSEAPELRHGVLDVNEKYLTTVSDAYAIGDAINLKHARTSELEAQGEAFARTFSGEETFDQPLKPEVVFAVEGIHLAQFGQAEAGEGVQEQVYVQKEPFIYKKFLIQHGCLKGALLVNAAQDESAVRALYVDKTPVEGHLEQFEIPQMAASNGA